VSISDCIPIIGQLAHPIKEMENQLQHVKLRQQMNEATRRDEILKQFFTRVNIRESIKRICNEYEQAHKIVNKEMQKA